MALWYTGAVFLSGSWSNVGNKSLAKVSEASLGTNEGKWSMEHTDNFGPAVVSTRAVGLSKSVITVYTGIGLFGLVVSADTSTIVLNFLFSEFKVSELTNGGMGWDK